MMKEMAEEGLNSDLWHACAGGMVQMLPVNSKVFYFAQGHAEHTLSNLDFGALPIIPPMILCRVATVKYLADPETDEIYAKIGLIPVGNNEHGFNDDDDDDDGVFRNKISESNEKLNPFAKTLTQSDANNGGGFSVPRYCAETVFPPLDYTADPPVQNLIARDVHGGTWKFRHIYRGTPRRHLLTTGWSAFVNQKKLVAGDSVVFLRSENGDLRVGIRRAAKRGFGISGSGGIFGGVSGFLEDKNKLVNRSFGNGNLRGEGKVRFDSVVEAALLAASGQPFEVVYYPRTSSVEFCVKVSAVRAAMRIQWCSGMRFKMAFETEDSLRISCIMGTIACVRVVDPIRWPNSPWRLLQVTWDEPDLVQNVNCVNPWLVQIVSNMPALHFAPFSPPRKKLRLLQHHPDFPLDGQFPMPSFSGNPLRPNSPLCCLSDNITTVGIQGARHAQIGVPFSDFHLSNKFLPLDPPNHAKVLDCTAKSNTDGYENVSCLLTMGISSQKTEKTDDGGVKTPQFVLFGQPILTEQQMSFSKVELGQMENFAALQDPLRNLSTVQFFGKRGHHADELGQTGHCKVFLESEVIGRTLDLSVLGSYEELYKMFEIMFGIKSSDMLSHLFYHDATGAVKPAGEEPFRELVSGLPTAERGLDSSSQAGPPSIFAQHKLSSPCTKLSMNA